MNFKDIKTAAQAYCDRYDEELESSIPAFMSVVIGKINNALRTGEQSVRSQIVMELDREYYGLPSDWGGARDVEILKEGKQHGRSLSYLAPPDMNKLKRKHHHHNHHKHGYYTIIADQIQVAPPSAGEILEITYYQRLQDMVNDSDSNWLCEKNPDALIFGLCTEISAFAKDDMAFASYDARFKESLNDITMADQVTRWSGPTMYVQVDGLIV